MELLQVLEQKASQLVSLVKELQEENKFLQEENSCLAKNMTDLNNELNEVKALLLTGKEAFEEEKSLTKMTVDEIIKNIDSLISTQDQL